MNKVILATALALLAAPVLAQKVKAKPRGTYVNIQSLRLPLRALGPEVRSVSTSVSTTTETEEATGLAVPRLKELGQIPGFPRAHSGDLHIEFIPGLPTYGRDIAFTDASSNVKWEMLVPVYMTVDMRLLRPGGEVVWHERFGADPDVRPVTRTAPPGSTLRMSGEAPALQYKGKLIINQEAAQPYLYKVKGTALMEGTPANYLSGRWDEISPTAASRTVKNSLAPAIKRRLAQFSYGLDTSRYVTKSLGGNHPAVERYNAAADTLIEVIKGLHVGIDAAAYRQRAATAQAELVAIARDLSGSEDKQDIKVRRAAFQSVLESQVALNQYDDALALIETLSEEDRKKVAGRSRRLIAERRELFANGPYSSTYDPKLSTSYTPTSKFADAAGNVERFGLLQASPEPSEATGGRK